MELVTALLIGFAGSFHCIGMCGPIALALPVSGFNKKTFIPGRLLYNLGRIFSYSLMGALFGLLGGRVIFAGLQQGLSIFLGIFILLALALPVKYKNILLGASFIQALISKLKIALGIQFRNRGLSALFITGVLNGFLPCGFVYIGLAASAAAGGLFKGAAVMLMFGLGTTPVLLAVSTFSRIISVDFRRSISKATPYFAALLAVVFILRGLNLGIPYLSPNLGTEVHSQTEMKCH